MRKSVAALLYFASGALFGASASALFLRNRYAQIAQEEIDSVKSVFKKKSTRDNAKPIAECLENFTKRSQDFTESHDNRATVDDIAERINAVSERVNAVERSYVISPDEFGEFDDYEKVSLTYYADHILADDNDELVDDIEQTVGLDSLNRFGEYEDDSVFVRNDNRRCDYEILLDERAYTDVAKGK